jgi:predicted metal-dependent enzyme (double-stranded beta helix superfamily)
MSYELEQFIADCRRTLKADSGPAGRDKVRGLLEQLVSDKNFIAKHCSASAPFGLHVLYDDPELGFQVLAHINEKARVSPPHDHGASWAIYAQAASYTDMTEWDRIASGPDKGKLREIKKYRLMPGEAGIYQNGAIHSIDYPGRSCFIRVTGTNLDMIVRSKYDLATGAETQMTPQRAS